MNEKKILITDDEQWVRQILEKKFKREGYHTLVAGNGLEALELAKTQKPDCILLDIKMPELNGLDACKELKNDPDTRHIPVIILSAKAELFDKRAGMAAGADIYLTKPVKFSAILEQVKKVLS